MKERLIWADLLRITACLMVIGIHTSGSYYYVYERLTDCWWIAVIINSFGHFAVPCFFMLSGMFMLNPKKEISIKSIYKHSTPKLVELVLYSIAVSLGVFFVCRLFNSDYKYINEAPVHTIFQIMILYFLTPGFRVLVSHPKEFKYTTFILVFLSLFVSPLKNLPYIGCLSTEIYEANRLIVSASFYLLGYYLYSMPKTIHWAFLFTGIITACLMHLASLVAGLDNHDFFITKLSLVQVIQLDTLLISISIFLLFKQYVNKIMFNEKCRKVISIAGKATMYIYVTHMGVLRLLTGTKLFNNSPIQVPLYIFLNFIICLLSSYIYIYMKKVIVAIKKMKNSGNGDKI